MLEVKKVVILDVNLCIQLAGCSTAKTKAVSMYVFRVVLYLV